MVGSLQKFSCNFTDPENTIDYQAERERSCG